MYLVHFFFHCFSIEFCDPNCDWMTELTCEGEWDEYGKELLSGQYCIPKEIGNCPNSCPIKCEEGQILCRGKMDPEIGCYGQYFCNDGSEYLPICSLDSSKAVNCL